MADRSAFSPKLLENVEAQSDAALDRIFLAKKRILSILDREVVAHQKTLEQKISDQGPTDQRVDPHLVGMALMDMLELNRTQKLEHKPTKTRSWYANRGTSLAEVNARLAELAPLYDSVTGGGFGNLTGDALEVVTFKCIRTINDRSPRFAYQGHFFLDRPKINRRFQKTPPPKTIGGNTTLKEADFIQFGFDEGPLCIECKNYREWLYPRDDKIKELIIKSYELDAIPVLLDRRIHYTTITNLLFPAGIIAHETYHQYYPSDQVDLANRVRNRRLLGFTDVLATEEPHPRTLKFFETDLPRIVPSMSQKWRNNKSALYEFANRRINLAELYTAIGSPAGGKWASTIF